MFSNLVYFTLSLSFFLLNLTIIEKSKIDDYVDFFIDVAIEKDTKLSNQLKAKQNLFDYEKQIIEYSKQFENQDEIKNIGLETLVDSIRIFQDSKLSESIIKQCMQALPTPDEEKLLKGLSLDPNIRTAEKFMIMVNFY